MLDLSFLDPPIEVAASGPRLESILTRLRNHGMRAYPASNPIDFDATEPLLIDMESLPSGLRDRDILLNEGAERRPLVLLTPDTQTAEGLDVLIVSRDSDLEMLKARLTSLVRRQAQNRRIPNSHGNRRNLSGPRDVHPRFRTPSGSPLSWGRWRRLLLAEICAEGP
jgi:hypothetical protein